VYWSPLTITKAEQQGVLARGATAATDFDWTGRSRSRSRSRNLRADSVTENNNKRKLDLWEGVATATPHTNSPTTDPWAVETSTAYAGLVAGIGVENNKKNNKNAANSNTGNSDCGNLDFCPQAKASSGLSDVSGAALDVSNAADPVNGRRTYYDDAGAVDYAAIIPLVVRRTKNIIVLLNSAYNNGHDIRSQYSPVGRALPLAGSTNPSNVEGWDDSLRAYFGWGLPGREQVSVRNWKHSHLFKPEALCSEFEGSTAGLEYGADGSVTNTQGCIAGLAAELWKLKKAGKPLVHTMSLDVVRNDFYGIAPTAESNYKPTVTFVVLQRAENHVKQLPAELSSLLSPTFEHDYTEQGLKISNFPNFKADAQNKFVDNTGDQVPEISLTPLQTRMLADYATWSVIGNEEAKGKFRQAFGKP